MAQYQLSEPDDLIECPYNSAHLVKALRFPYHLIKCRKKNPNMEFAVCPFNARHEMPYAELRFHIARCIDRTVLEQDLAHAQACGGDSGHMKGNTSVPAYNDASDTAPSEDWDTESPAYSRLQNSAANRNTKQAPRQRVEGDTREGSTGDAREDSVVDPRVNSVGDARMDTIGDTRVKSVGQQKHNERNYDEETPIRHPVEVRGDAPTRQPRGLPAVLQMAQQSRLCNVEKQDAKRDTSTENVICAPPTTDALSCDSRSKQELLLRSLARGRGTGRGTATPPVGYAARQLTSALGRGRGVALNVGRGVMCLSQFPDT